VERHLGGHFGQPLREKMRCAHPTFDRAEGMLHSLPADSHCIGVMIEPILNFLQNSLMLPSRDAALGAWRALRFQRAGFAAARPIAAQCLSILYILTAIS